MEPTAIPFTGHRNASVFESLEAIVSPPSVSPPGKVISLWTCAYPRLLNATEIVSWKGTSAVQGDWYFDAVADDWYPPPVDF